MGTQSMTASTKYHKARSKPYRIPQWLAYTRHHVFMRCSVCDENKPMDDARAHARLQYLHCVGWPCMGDASCAIVETC